MGAHARKMAPGSAHKMQTPSPAPLHCSFEKQNCGEEVLSFRILCLQGKYLRGLDTPQCYLEVCSSLVAMAVMERHLETALV